MLTGIVILAAGHGSRLKASLPKPLVSLMGLPLVSHILQKVPADLPTYIIASPKHAEHFKKLFPAYTILTQDPPKGTAHALTENISVLKKYNDLIILNADTPLIPKSLIIQLIQSKPNTLVAFKTTNTAQYGQITTNNGLATQITEAKDRQGTHLSNLCYAGIMKISRQYLNLLLTIKASQYSNEYYLTALVTEKTPFHIVLSDPDCALGINTTEELLQAERNLKIQTNTSLLAKKTQLNDYHTVYITANTTVGYHCHIASHTSIINSNIGDNCSIGQGAIIENSNLGNNVTILPYSIISNCTIEQNAKIGPFAHIQEKTIIGPNAQIGNFVEVKRSIIKEAVKAKHLAYIADAYVDHHANIGAGVITCNYVPWRQQKQMTYIGSYTLIGANSLLIAPCYIGDHAVCAAGSIITQTIMPLSLAISRPDLSIKSGFVPSTSILHST